MTGDADVIERLVAFATPTISNALEILGEDPTVGFTDGSIRPLSAVGAIFAGRAVTATVLTAARAAAGEPRVSTEDYWRYVASRPGPTVAVVQDLDPEPVGSMWGEVQGRVHRGLEVAGVVTNGAVRDLTELTAMDFPILGSRAAVSHGHARYREVGVPVTVGGVEIREGDLVHVDRHGLQLIPGHIDLDELVRVATEIEERERELFAAADRADGIESFLSAWDEVRKRWPTGDGGTARTREAIA